MRAQAGDADICKACTADGRLCFGPSPSTERSEVSGLSCGLSLSLSFVLSICCSYGEHGSLRALSVRTTLQYGWDPVTSQSLTLAKSKFIVVASRVPVMIPHTSLSGHLCEHGRFGPPNDTFSFAMVVHLADLLVAHRGEARSALLVLFSLYGLEAMTVVSLIDPSQSLWPRVISCDVHSAPPALISLRHGGCQVGQSSEQ